MVVHGSSRILEISGISSLTGPTGSAGTGGAGGTYGRTGDRGPTGFTGFGITFAYGTSTGPSGHEQQIIFELGGFQGGTYGSLWGPWRDGISATAVDAIDTTGLLADRYTDHSFTILIPTSAGGLGGTAITVLLDASESTSGSGGANQIMIGVDDGISDAERARLIIEAINNADPTVETKINYATSGNGEYADDIGITAKQGSSDTQITLTVDDATLSGNVSSAIASVLGSVDIVDVTDFTGGSNAIRGTTLGVTNVIGGGGDAINDDFHILNTVGINGITYGVGYGELFKTKVGITAHFRNLTFSGRDISVNEYSDYIMLIGGVTYEFGRMGNTGELLYTNPELGGLSAQGAPNTFWSGDQLTARILTHKELSESNNNLTAEEDSHAALPINASPVVSTSNLDGTAVTFSSIFSYDDEYNGEGSTAIASGIHFGGEDGGTIYQFAGVTFDTKYIIADNQIGSCCYCSGDGVNQDRRGCVDYVTKTYCDEIAGNFSLDVCLSRSSDEECYSGDACCVNGVCVETSETKCQFFGGFYIAGLNCAEVKTEGDSNTSTGCPEPCGVKGACCINNECYELTEVECSFFDSQWFDKPCEDEVGSMVTNCCLESNIGACCVDEVCYHCSAFVCAKLKSESGTGESTGVFWGIGSRCAGMNLVENYDAWDDEAYFPYNCLLPAYGDEPQGKLREDGQCEADGSDPPCYPCIGWQQVMPGGGSCEDGDPASACLCEEINCICEPNSNPPYTPYSCFDNLSCGTIRLVSGECWECCRNQPKEDEVNEPIGSCCTDQDGDGVYECSSLTKEDCLALYGYFSYKECSQINCNSGACCHGDGWCEPNTTPSTCNGTWIAGDCGGPGNNPCDYYRSLGNLPIPQTPSTILPKSGSGTRRAGGVPRNISRREERKTVDRPDAKQECPTSTNIPSCIDPGIAIAPVNNDQWTIDVGCGECSCCCPGVCWKGALGNGGIVNDCMELGERCYQTLDCSNNQCVSNSNESYPVNSVPNILPLCTDIEWEANELECVPYVDVSDPDNPVWMICSCCCTNGCLEYTEPVPCSECEDRGKDGQCICVGGCDDCFR